jgi:hypothetical protein
MQNSSIRSKAFRPGLVLAALVLFCCSYSHSVEISVSKLPRTEKEFLTLRDKLAVTPEGGAAVFLVSMMVFSEDRKLGLQFFTIALSKDNLTAGSVYKGFKPDNGVMYHIDRLADPKRKRTPYAYVSGTDMENGYQASPPFKFVINTNQYSRTGENRIKVFVDCSASSYPRPITMQKNDKNLWKALEISSMSLDVPMPDETKDDL